MNEINLPEMVSEMRKACREGTIAERCLELIASHGTADIHFGPYTLLAFLIGNDVEACKHALENVAIESTWKRDKRVPEMHFAAGVDDPTFVEMLAKHGFSVAVKDRDGNTPLHVAVQSHKTATANKLFELGVDPEVANKRKETPRDLAKLYDVRGLIFA